MSPLARSLLALAAVLVVATTLPRCNAYCSEADVGVTGRTDIVLQTVHVNYPGGDVTYNETMCNSRGAHQCGEHIVACNSDPAGPPPNIDTEDIPPGKFEPVRIYSDYSGADVTITVHCS